MVLIHYITIILLCQLESLHGISAAYVGSRLGSRGFNGNNETSPSLTVDDSLGTLQTSNEHDYTWPMQRRCFRRPSAGERLSVENCRRSLREITEWTKPNFNKAQEFRRERSPNIQGITPPMVFHSYEDHCQIIIDVGIDYSTTRSVFRFSDVKRAAQEILQSCQDEGLTEGGIAPVGRTPGWFVEVSRMDQSELEASMDPPLNLSSPVSIERDTVEDTKDLPETVQCSEGRGDWKFIPLHDCLPVTELLTNAKDSKQVHKFVWGREPYLEGHGFPPFSFEQAFGPCQISISTHDFRRETSLSLYYVGLAAEVLMVECTRASSSQSGFYGGSLQLQKLDGWYVTVQFPGSSISMSSVNQSTTDVIVSPKAPASSAASVTASSGAPELAGTETVRTE